MILISVLYPLDKEEVRRGWVRIHEDDRQGIPENKIALLTNLNSKKKVRRIILGIPDGLKGQIKMDEVTRKALGFTDNNIRTKVEVDIKESNGIFSQIYYYWTHPDFPLAFSTKVAIILGGLSVLLGILSVVLSLGIRGTQYIIRDK